MPAAQPTHTEDEFPPKRALYLPAEQAVHAEAFARELYVPTGHLVQTRAPPTAATHSPAAAQAAAHTPSRGAASTTLEAEGHAAHRGGAGAEAGVALVVELVALARGGIPAAKAHTAGRSTTVEPGGAAMHTVVGVLARRESAEPLPALTAVPLVPSADRDHAFTLSVETLLVTKISFGVERFANFTQKGAEPGGNVVLTVRFS